MLEISFALDRLSDFRVFFRVDEHVNIIALREIAAAALLVLINAAHDVVCDAHVKRSILLTGKDVDKISAPHRYLWMAGSSPAMTPRCLLAHTFQTDQNQLLRLESQHGPLGTSLTFPTSPSVLLLSSNRSWRPIGGRTWREPESPGLQTAISTLRCSAIQNTRRRHKPRSSTKEPSRRLKLERRWPKRGGRITEPAFR
jgi:hypothetical protein